MSEYLNFPGKGLNVTIIQSNKFFKKNKKKSSVTGFVVFLKVYIYIYIYIYKRVLHLRYQCFNTHIFYTFRSNKDLGFACWSFGITFCLFGKCCLIFGFSVVVFFGGGRWFCSWRWDFSKLRHWGVWYFQSFLFSRWLSTTYFELSERFKFGWGN